MGYFCAMQLDPSFPPVFRKRLLDWAALTHRPMPWKGIKDPYKIWLSEIILQQTRVEQGLPYYEKFISRYPSVRHLAEAPEDEVLKCWEGLGYYARARNMHAAAKSVASAWGGDFPDTYEDIRQLKGVGDYTAAAIASFAFDLPYAVLDGNVYRVLSRLFGISLPIDSPGAKKTFGALAQALLDPERPGSYNQAMMDFGAVHCTPQLAQCHQCPFADICVAFKEGSVSNLPVKSKKLIKKDRFFLYLVLMHEGDTFLQKRTAKDIWQNLYEFPMLELAALPSDQQQALTLVQEQVFEGRNLAGGLPAHLSKTYKQALTHQLIQAVFLKISLPELLLDKRLNSNIIANSIRVPFESLQKNFAFPRIIDLYLQEKVLTLGL